MKKGFTLVEVILAITLVSIISIFFLPGITFTYKYLIESKKFTQNVFETQMEIENLLEEKRKEEPTGENVEKIIFGMKIKGHNIIPIESSGEINVFQPKNEYYYAQPEIIRDVNSGLINIVRLSAFNKNNEISPPPKKLKMYQDNGQLDTDINFLVDKKYYKIKDPKIFLVNVYRWYTSSMVEYSDSFLMDNYFIIKEWNAARPLISYEESKILKSIPNIQNDPDYNRLTFSEIKTGLSLNDTDFINQYGNRYYYFSITPFAISGKIGNEEFSNSIYIEAPRIEIDKAVFGPDKNQFSIYFKDSIEDVFSIDKIVLNENLGKPVGISRADNNNKVMIFDFDNTLNQDVEIEGNILQLGSVQSLKYGAIHIWSNDAPIGEFIIKKN